jgi:hypothetical protein
VGIDVSGPSDRAAGVLFVGEPLARGSTVMLRSNRARFIVRGTALGAHLPR